jgi:hypothetical protein
MTKPLKTKTTRLVVSLRYDIERFLDALFREQTGPFQLMLSAISYSSQRRTAH